MAGQTLFVQQRFRDFLILQEDCRSFHRRDPTVERSTVYHFHFEIHQGVGRSAQLGALAEENAGLSALRRYIVLTLPPGFVSILPPRDGIQKE